MEIKSNLEILLVEDNPGDKVLVWDYLEEEFPSARIHNASDFSQAQQTLLEHSHKVDIVLLDLKLPDMQGEELAYKIIELSVDRPVIILTGMGDIDFAVKSLSMGISDYLLKDSLTPAILYKSIIYSLERNKNLLRLKESEQRYADLFHLSPQPMWVYDMDTLMFMDVNAAAIQHYGYSYQEFLTMNIKDIRPKTHIAKLEESLRNNQNLKMEYSMGEFIHCKKNGEEIIVEIRGKVISYKDRKAKLILATDVTQQYQYVQKIEKQNQALREIAWTQSHVVRAPLSRLMALNQQLMENDLTEDEMKMFLMLLDKSAGELDKIIRKIVLRTEKIELGQ